MRIVNSHIKTLIICASLIIFLVLPLSAQPGNPAGDVDPVVPISGIELLIALGSLLGLRKFIGTKKKSN
jgi:hypothetical protein